MLHIMTTIYVELHYLGSIETPRVKSKPIVWTRNASPELTSKSNGNFVSSSSSEESTSDDDGDYQSSEASGQAMNYLPTCDYISIFEPT